MVSSKAAFLFTQTMETITYITIIIIFANFVFISIYVFTPNKLYEAYHTMEYFYFPSYNLCTKPNEVEEWKHCI